MSKVIILLVMVECFVIMGCSKYSNYNEYEKVIDGSMTIQVDTPKESK